MNFYVKFRQGRNIQEQVIRGKPSWRQYSGLLYPAVASYRRVSNTLYPVQLELSPFGFPMDLFVRCWWFVANIHQGKPVYICIYTSRLKCCSLSDSHHISYRKYVVLLHPCLPIGKHLICFQAPVRIPINQEKRGKERVGRGCVASSARWHAAIGPIEPTQISPLPLFQRFQISIVRPMSPCF